MSTPNRGIPYVPENTLDPAAGLNEALDTIDAVFVPGVIAMDETDPPGSPSDGDLYVPAAPAAGAWENLENYVVRYRAEGSFWQSYAPESVLVLLNRANGGLYKWDTGSWVLAGGLGDAPNDGTPYVRQSEAWVAVSRVAAAVVTEAGAARAAAPGDAGAYVRFTSGVAKTYTFDAAETWVVNTEFHGRNHGAGSLTIATDNGMTINPPAGGSLVIPSGGTFTVKIVAADEADLFGLVAAP